MTPIDQIYFYDLPDHIKDQIAREYEDDFDNGYNPDNYKEFVLVLMEYDPNDAEDLENLNFFLNQKIDSEGQPNEPDLEYYRNDISLLISSPCLFIGETCCEGRHRLSVALETKSKFRAYVL